MKKQTGLKLLSLLLTLVLLCTACAGAPAAVRIQQPDAPRAVVLSASTPNENPFTDVPDGTWYTDAVLWCLENGIMRGTSATTFSPNTTMTRSMMASVLYNAAGSPEPGTGPAFTDVQSGQWYSDAVAWATAEGIMSGYGGGLFGPSNPVTREQAVTILWNREGSPAATAEDFTDEADISAFIDCRPAGGSNDK